MLFFARPEFLLLGLLAPLILWWGARGKMPRAVPWRVSVLRAVLILLLALALASPQIRLNVRRMGVAAVVDASGSTTWAAEEKRAEQLESLCKTAAEKGVEWRERVVEGSFRVGSELLLTAALLPEDVNWRVLVLTDGQSAGGAREAWRAGMAGKFLAGGADVKRTFSPEKPEVALTGAGVQDAVRNGVPVAVWLEAGATQEQRVRVDFFLDGVLADRRELVFPEGVSRHVVDGLPAVDQPTRLTVRLSAAEDSEGQNNTLSLLLNPGKKLRAVVVDSAGTMQPMAELLREQGFEVDLMREAPDRERELEDVDLVVLGGGGEISPDQALVLEQWVRQGGGLFVLGNPALPAARRGAGRLRRILPLEATSSDEMNLPSAAIEIVLDRSGSMAAPLDGRTKMDLANEAAVAVLPLLKPGDSLGVLAVDVRVHEVNPLEPVRNADEVMVRIRGVGPGGGGIYVYTALVEAYRRLREVQAAVRHVLLFADAADAEEKYAGELTDGTPVGGTALDLAQSMRAAGVTLSVVALGGEKDKDAAFLQELAGRGGGRYYLTADARMLPRLFLSDATRTLRTNRVERGTKLRPVRWHETLRGVDFSSAPGLGGYYHATPAADARVVLEAEDGTPLWALRRHGSGMIGVFASDPAGTLGGGLSGWPGFGQFLAQAARHVARREVAGELVANVDEDDGLRRVRVDARNDAGELMEGLELEARMSFSSGEEDAEPMRQMAPGYYEKTFRNQNGAPETVRVSGGEKGQITVNIPSAQYAAEDSHPFVSDGQVERLAAVAAVAGGEMDVDGAEVFRPVSITRSYDRNLTLPLLLLAVLLFPLDVYWKRRAAMGR